MKERLLRILLAAGCLYAGACTLNRETILPDTDSEGEEITVTFSLSTDGQMVSSRADDETGLGEDGKTKTKQTISNGTKIDKVVYAVYVPESDGSYRILTQYGNGSEELGEGQALLESTDELLTTGEHFSLRLMRGQTYTIGFWAQSSECSAYDSKNLEAVVVDYTDGNSGFASNNDEIRDAFCLAYTFEAKIGVTEYVILKRALAQINVGTSGWDYNNEVVYGNSYAYSKIEMTGLNNKLNVLTGDVGKTEGFSGEVTYDWAKLPAYIKSETYPADVYPNYPTDTEENHNKFAEWLKNPGNDDEFLYVKLVDDKQTYLPYITEEPEEDGISTEVFKYLSMCYVLAPTAPYTDGAVASSGLAIDELKFYLAEFIEDGEGYVYENYEKTNKELAPLKFTLSDVPVQRNWRTNILGGTRKGEDNSLFDPRSISLWIDLDTGYYGDHYHYISNSGSNDPNDNPECDDWTDPNNKQE